MGGADYKIKGDTASDDFLNFLSDEAEARIQYRNLS